MADYYLQGKFRAPCQDLPPEYARQEPTVAFDTYILPNKRVHEVCAEGKTIFQPITAYSIPPRPHYPDWRIVVSDFLSDEDHACVMMYEKAHLPPNNWKDQAWEDAGFKGSVYEGRVDAEVEP